MRLFSRRFWLLQAGYFVFSLCSVFLKSGSRYPFLSKTFSLHYAGGILCVLFFAIIWQQVLRKYDLIIAYAWRGTLFLWTFLWAVLLFGETVTWNNVIGAIVIVCGIFIVIRNE